MSTLFWLVAAAVFLLGSSFFSGSEMGLYSMNRIRLRLCSSQNDPRARVLMRLMDRQDETVLAVLLSNNVMNYLLTVAVVALLIRATNVGSDHADVYAALILSPITIVFGDVVPKNWFQARGDRLMYPAARVVQLSVWLLRCTGVLLLLQWMTRLVARLTGESREASWRGARGEIVGLLREGAAEGVLSEEQTAMVERVMNLSTVRAGTIMIPRHAVVTISEDATRAVFEDLVRKYPYSRLPVLSTNQRSVVGILNIYDILTDETGGSIARWMKPPVIIPASTTAPQILIQLRQARAAMAIVTDPRRGFVGLVTLKDVVEEIFGELAAW